ncbi:hypothetical protein CC1G_14824 [Coprinopsis cinerea okayama7|uniref:Uncharacterized protein n=1 Tax=Coprinopsis cinerea (strain Okayama-7 / 130 / ATCC MYA-4618 / FGSC 9003) TaxID=240176 RepID=D6RNU9_COPC7|nr:hypothetical protein CC1G_14824 [Coprinopsis cinerea okayama7\|eukprot:XP_002910845.1 hypothetical protein CC1G_14824 [Coprinopsis cinerea okayama7\
MDSSSSSSFARRHRRAVSSPKNAYTPSQITPTSSTRNVSAASADTPRPPRTASSIMISVKRTFTPSKRRSGEHSSHMSRSGMYSTPEERMSPCQPQVTQFHAHSHIIAGPAPPTIEQIAMGLHISRTPHLRPLTSTRSPYSQRNHSAPARTRHGHSPVLPPPPTRSSMKKPTATVSSSSSQAKLRTPVPPASSPTPTTSSSAAPSSSRSTHSGFSFSKFRMGRFLSGSRSSSAPSSSLISTPVSSPRQSTSDLEALQRKAVRFQNTEDEDDERD